MNEQYKKDELIIKDIKKNVTDNNSYKIGTHIYYRNQKVNNLIIKNNLTQKNDILAKSHVIYEIKCPVGDCELQSGAIMENLAT